MLIPVTPVFLVMRSASLCHVSYKASSQSCCRPVQKLHLESPKCKVYCELRVIVHVPVCSSVVKEELSNCPEETWQMRCHDRGCVIADAKSSCPRATEKIK